MNIILVGLRGSGKSTVGKIISRKLNKTFYDLDSIIIKKEKKTIPELVGKYGWEYFRERETETIKEISKGENSVIATGGGTIKKNENIDMLKKKGKFIFLKTSLEQITARIGDDKSRPSLEGKKSFIDEMQEIWIMRKPIYEQVEDIIIETDDKSPEEVANEIISRL